jgi:RNA polymerase sigma factor (TIGR02999 family)
MVQGELSKLDSSRAPVMNTALDTGDIHTGDGHGGNRLFAVLYDELHRVASLELRRNAAASLTPTTLLHETFLSFSLRESWELSDRPRFMAYAVRAMRGLIIDCLRRGNSQMRDIEIEKLRAALDALTGIDARLAECVDLKFFCGFSFAEIAQLWNVPERTVHRDWDKARLLLYRLVGGVDSGKREIF